MEGVFNPLVLIAIIYLFGPAAVLGFIAWGLLSLISLAIFGHVLHFSGVSFMIIYNYFTAEEIEYPKTELYCSAVSYECTENDFTCLERNHYIPASFYINIDRDQLTELHIKLK